MSNELYVSCLGLACAVGLTPQGTCAALRAGIAGFTESPFRDDCAEPIIAAMAPGLDPDLRGQPRLMELLKLAIPPLAACLPEGLDPSTLPLMLCTREADRPGAELQGLVGALERHLGVAFPRQQSQHFPSGSVATFEALEHARQMIDTTPSQALLLVAVDSFLDARALHWLNSRGRLKRDAHSDATIPGEAAGVALVSRQSREGSSLIRGLGFAREEATIFNDLPLRGDGMAEAARVALNEAGIPLHEIDYRLADPSGETYAFEELALAQSRLLSGHRETQDLFHPGSCVGDCGAVNGLLQMAWAAQASLRGYACGPLALAHTATPSGARACAVLAGVFV